MRSSFFEFRVASSGLHVARAGLEVTSHNVANASTKGYSRQTSLVKANTPLTFYDGRGMVGTGASAYGIGQIRNFYIDKKYWSENSVLGHYSVKDTELSLTEGILNDLGDTGIKQSFNNFFKGLQDLTTNAGDPTYKTSIAQLGDTLATFVNSTAESLRKQQQDINTDIKTVVTTINSYAEQISSLNRQITTYELDGSNANDLRDQRALIVDSLSKLVNLDVSEKDYSQNTDGTDKRFIVLINGSELVNHFDNRALKLEERNDTTTLNSMDAGKLYDIKWSSGAKFDIYSPKLKGELKGLVDMRDGNNGVGTIDDPVSGGKKLTTTFKGIPHYLNKLNKLVQVFSQAINHGLDAKGVSIPGVDGHVNGFNGYDEKGTLFFTYKDANGNNVSTINPLNGDYENMDCFNFSINKEILLDPELIASSDVPNAGEVSNNNIILGLIKVGSYNSLFKEGKLEDYVIGITTEIGISKKQAENFTNNYSEIVVNVENQRKAISSVDVNEEIINMVKFNQMYQASAKLINIIDGIYDTCINKLGVR